MDRPEDVRDVEQMISRFEGQAQKLKGLLKQGQLYRPVFIEFAGTPKSGKTTALDALDLFLRRNGLNAFRIQERAEAAPVTPKGQFHFNAWTTTDTLAAMFAAAEYADRYPFVLIDRGPFDALCWMTWLQMQGKASEEETEAFRRFILLDRCRSLCDLVFVLKVDPERALEREYANRLTRRPGRIMNVETLRELNEAIDRTYECVGQMFRHIEVIDTTESEPLAGVAHITNYTLRTLDGFLSSPTPLQEQVMVVSRSALGEAGLLGGFISEPDYVEALLSTIQDRREFVPRSDAEQCSDTVQILACAVFRRGADLLLLRRHDPGGGLDEKYLVWVGGHVRKQDARASGADPVRVGLEREVREELAEAPSLGELSPAGIVYDEADPHVAMHAGIVFFVQVPSHAEVRVNAAPGQQEFKQQRGTSVSGSFRSVEEIRRYTGDMDAWSRAVLRDHFGVQLGPAEQPGLPLP